MTVPIRRREMSDPAGFTDWLRDNIHDRALVGHIARRCRDLPPDVDPQTPSDVHDALSALDCLTPSYLECLDVATEEFFAFRLARTMSPHALYRFFDRHGNLLYVGLTMNPGTRWPAHSKEKPWWLEVARITIEHYPTRAEVEDAEIAAIRSEQPAYNVLHNRMAWAPS